MAIRKPRGFLGAFLSYSSTSIIRAGDKLPGHVDVVGRIEDREVWGLTRLPGLLGWQSAVRDDSRGFAAVFVREAAEGGFEEPLHLVGGAGDCCLDVGRVVGDGKGLMVFWAGFEDTALVLDSGASAFVAVLVGQMDLNAGEMRFESV
jgi:hypothetical protein